MKTFVLFFCCLLCFTAYAQEDATAFFLQIFSDKITVRSPKKLEKNLNITIENKTLFNLTAKIANSSKDLIFVTIFANSKNSVSIKLETLESLKFIPISPSIHEVELVAGRDTYEIP